MNAQNYLAVNKATNVVDNVTVWDGDTQTWTPPESHLFLVQATTNAKVWELNAEGVDYDLVVVQGVGGIGFTWDGSVLTTNEPKPTIEPAPNQPSANGVQEI
jgi:hypothetical protein